MPFSLPRYRTGDAELDALIAGLVDATGATANQDLLFEIEASGVRLARSAASRLDLKISSAALKEMRAAFDMFAPYRDVPKVTIFGSARTLPDSPVYQQARDFAAAMAAAGWMVVTGAGPGIMQAGMEGAGRDRSLGVSIRLPFETSANPMIAGDNKLVSMKYFFTRKLMLMKESKGFVALPGGFGTLDETLELLTLQQTGKAQPAPLVLLDTPGTAFWQPWEDFCRDVLATEGLIGAEDLDLYLRTDDVTEACDAILDFYRNYHSLRWVGDQLVVRMTHAPSDAQLATLNANFGHLCGAGAIERGEPRPIERKEHDHLDLARVILTFDPSRPSMLHPLIRAINQFVPDVHTPGAL